MYMVSPLPLCNSLPPTIVYMWHLSLFYCDSQLHLGVFKQSMFEPVFRIFPMLSEVRVCQFRSSLFCYCYTKLYKGENLMEEKDNSLKVTSGTKEPPKV